MAASETSTRRPSRRKRKSWPTNSGRTTKRGPTAAWRRTLREHLYPVGHPYRRFGADPTELATAHADEALAFYHSHYAPNDAALVVVGDFRSASAMASIEKYFGPLPARTLAPLAPPAPVALVREDRVDLVADVERARVDLVWPTPAVFQPAMTDLELAAQILGGTDEARLTRRLVRELQLAEQVYVGPNERRDGSEFKITVVVRPGHGADEVIRAIDEELAKLRDEPVPGDELARARAPYVRGFVAPLESSMNRAELIAGMWDFTGDPGFLPKLYEQLQAVTPESLRAAVNTFLPAQRRLVLRVEPKKGAPVCAMPVGAALPASGGGQ